MRFIIIYGNKAFYTNWYSEEKHTQGMIVIDIQDNCMTIDGISWTDIDHDHL